MYKLILIMIIVFNTATGGAANAQESNTEAATSRIDSLRQAHMARAAKMRQEIMERQAALRKDVASVEGENIVIIDGEVFTDKDSLEVNREGESEVKVKGNANSVIIENKGAGTVSIVQSGSGNSAIVRQQKVGRKEDNQ
ncbi:hypothetical protein MM239_13245 [Belliella sp. DSM 111904]|uniref:Uncharacterized protein n=1 Tax=Belliella filtrata TaxID=2923435 RepID=A0ABS9V1R1_9BACT|nr:hypothetical protein [Belliella filtrata]MCH7410367.1 hypothetical protein [Belliella filtrata]